MEYYCIKQYDMKDCGAACIATISKQYGYKIPITKIREVAGTDKQGTNVAGLIKALESIGFSAKGVKGTPESLFTEFPLPAIAHVIKDEKILHYVVIHKITKKEITIADPAKGIVKYTPEDFLKIWTGVLVLTTPSTEFKKGDDTQGLFERFFHLLIPQKKIIFDIFLASILYTIIGIIGAFYYQYLVDDVLYYNLTDTLKVISIGAIILILFNVVLEFFRSYMLLYLSQKLDISLLLGYYNHVIKLPMNFFGTRHVGEIISRFQDATKVREAISGATLTLMVDTLMVLIGGVILYMQNKFLFFITFVVAILYALIVFAYNKRLRNQNREYMESNSELTSYLVESLNGIQTVKSLNSEQKVNFETETRFIKLLDKVFKLQFTTTSQNAFKSLLDGVSGVVILWVGAVEVLNGNLSVGELLAFNSLLVYFLGPIKNIINLQPMLQTAIVASERLGEILDLEVEKIIDVENKKIAPESLNGGIEFQDISFRYGTRKLVIDGLTLTAKQGEKIALVGESGSGKTTIAKLLLGLYDVSEGEILINDNNIKDIQIETLRDKIAYVSQETFLFSGTIYDNLVLGLEDKTLEDVIEVCKMVKAHNFINEMPLRYQTLLDENGANLSGGQRQRLSIARALLKNPDILILDEATSNLDAITEKAIEDTIESFTRNMTLIIIAHRLSTIKKCNIIYVLRDGKVSEQGSHSELVASKGEYYELWKEQNLEVEVI